jgi:Flp pilus assembly protein TadB
MTPRDPLEIWKAERRGGEVPEGFSDRVMSAVRAAAPEVRPGRTISGRGSSALSWLALAAGALVVVACHAALVGAVLLALSGTAR